MPTYKITRNYFNNAIPRRTIKRGLTLEEAQAHCQDPETSSSTATSSTARARTKRLGAWFDGYDEEVPKRRRRMLSQARIEANLQNMSRPVYGDVKAWENRA